MGNAIRSNGRRLEGDLPLYVVTCFSDRDKLLNKTEKEG